jgi:hypothetical protein
MPSYPVMFDFKDVVSGNGFLSGVTLCGRALIERDQDGTWWVNGVQPSGIAECGAAAMEAFSNFRNSYKKVLFDIAEEASNFEAFEREVKRFYSENAASELERWNTAVQEFRAGKIQPEDPFDKLPKQAPEQRPCGLSVDRLDKVESKQFSSEFNKPDQITLPIAA